LAALLKVDADAVREVLVRHRRRIFTHWTPASAVPSVMEHGLLCRRELEARGIAYQPHGYGRAGKELEFAGHVVLGFLPHWGMMRSESGPVAILEINSRVVLADGTFFCPDNTARNDYDFSEASKWDAAKHLDDLFEDPTSYKSANYQAEIWVPDGVAVEDIVGVYFRTTEDRDAAIAAIGPLASTLPRKVFFGVQTSRFPEPQAQSEIDMSELF
jgi:hypothetical protein